MQIISKFAVGSDKGIDDLFDIKKAVIRNTYKENIPQDTIENYIKEHLDHRKMINVLNDLSNQLIMVYVDEQAVGYSLLKSSSSYSGSPEGKKMTKITDFGILPEYDTPEVRSSLWQKSRSAINFTDAIWINLNQNNLYVEFFKELGFIFVKDNVSEYFDIPAQIYQMELN